MNSKSQRRRLAIMRTSAHEREHYQHERAAHAAPVELTIRTKVPSKWRFVDLETGDVWLWVEESEHGKFRRAVDVLVESRP